MNQNFFLWYYTRGLQSSVVIFGNVVRSVLHRFHTGGHILSLFSPWKRDVTFKSWMGLHPILALQALFENFISRFLGMIVRLFVIALGLVMLILSVLLGIVGLFMYLMSPILIIGGLVCVLVNPLLGGALLLAGLMGAGSAFVGYTHRNYEEELTYDISNLSKRRWFGKLLGRLGLEKKELDSAVLKTTGSFVSYLSALGIREDTYEQAVRVEYEAALERDRQAQLFSWERLVKQAPLGKGWRYAYTSHLDRYALDLSEFDPTQYAKLKFIGRKEELKVMILTLERASQNNVLLISEPGIGKKTLIHHVSRLIRENFFLGTPLGDSRVLLFDIGRAASDAINQGVDVDGTIRDLLAEGYYAGNVVLVIENIDTYLGEGQSHQNLAPVLGEFLSLPNFRLIATMTAGRYHALSNTNGQLLKFFETIYLRETSEEETLQVLLSYARSLEGKRIVFSLPGLLSIIAQSSRYKWEVAFPERALDLAQEVLTYWEGNGEEAIIGPKTVEAFVSLKTGMPTGTIGSHERDKLLKLEEYLHERVIGQDEAVRQVAEAMRKARAGFGDAKRPLGSFIFLGPTGVGKTETVKAFAESYFGSEEHMIRLDMSEFQTPEAVARLIGSEAMNMPGQLTDLVKEHPFSILLLDELEKAYPQALDLFLQVLDEGFLTDAHGSKVSFRNTIIIATSNAGAAIIREGMAAGQPFDEIRKQVMDHIVENNIYRPEFLNRFDGVIFFEPLSESELLEVTELKLRGFAKRLKEEKNITIEFVPGVAEKIVAKGYEPEFGARSINRYIEDTIEDAVVNQIISGTVAPGRTLSVTADDL